MPLSNEETRQIAEDIAEQAIAKFLTKHPEAASTKAEIPAPLRWAAGIIATLFTTGIAGIAFWLVVTVSDMTVTLARVDERAISQSTVQESRFTDMDRRILKLEAYHVAGGK